MTLRKVRAGIQDRNLEAGIVEGHGLLACSPQFDQLAFLFVFVCFLDMASLSSFG